ncbi:hypothetical protein H3Z85_21490 [Chryseobacterium indologenes]|uniref:hypothetical protein n=1 Tax=Chryseobacterium indologenes TaxID=253 RepID=UPI0003E07C68|nr:hypothetical protein [Chryseobacterium indologenes]ASE61733.1 hypothetical protein CEQ15_09645 [Chryseobacterium indologenes]QPQ51755.1 hypothetical protein H3Z85_21490 [Chryseobacterium indologenes]SFI73110.1 hypothetical protein SAMN05421692_0516 [Chryseobacterium indologenes]SUX50275.1 Uncharacterised protein [Chryseobacterium indologenes]GAE64384.1 hypothetical protein CIN01S_07_03090 [Chryseobacterium indologenes NBRC 14944]
METQSNDIELVKNQASITTQVAFLNIEGITHEESMIFPNGEANCMNWVLGHLLYVRNGLLNVLGDQPVWENEKFSFYNRGVLAVDRKDEFLNFEELKSYLKQSQDKLDAKFNSIEKFNQDQIKDLATLCFHENYHSGQLGYIRRLLGKSGAIK